MLYEVDFSDPFLFYIWTNNIYIYLGQLSYYACILGYFVLLSIRKIHISLLSKNSIKIIWKKNVYPQSFVWKKVCFSAWTSTSMKVPQHLHFSHDNLPYVVRFLYSPCPKQKFLHCNVILLVNKDQLLIFHSYIPHHVAKGML